MHGDKPFPLIDEQGRPVPLTGVEIRGALAGPLFELTAVQRFRNPGQRAIEALYSFPVPATAVLLGVRARLGARQFDGVVTARDQARQDYESAIAAGDSALLVERVEAGMFSLALGNLLPGEEAELEFRYALPLRFDGNRLRIALPTTLAPRYGDPGDAGLEPYQVPTVAPAVEYPLHLEIRLGAPLSRGTIASPSHAIATRAEGDEVRVTLARRAWLDRDFVLEVALGEASPVWAAAANDDGGSALLLAFAPHIGARREHPLNLKLLVDCSGSMLGDSIEQARAALSAVLKGLRPQDRLSLTRFGSEVQHFHARMAVADRRNLFILGDAVTRMDADLGGTEMQAALQAVFALPGAEGSETVLLITDGEIYNSEGAIQAALQWGHRVFVVGVGSAVSEGFLRRLAEETGGAAAFVAPNEEMASAILRQFERMRAPRIAACRVAWPVPPDWETPLPKAIFGGDTVWIAAGLPTPIIEPAVPLSVTLRFDDETEETLAVPLVAHSLQPDLPRIAAALRLPGLTGQEARALALRHQLLSDQTSLLLTLQRAPGEKGEAQPDITQVPQMLAAGWGGAGSVCEAAVPFTMAPPPSPAGNMLGRTPMAKRARPPGQAGAAIDYLDVPAFLRSAPADAIDDGGGEHFALCDTPAPAGPDRCLAERLEALALQGDPMPDSLAGLFALVTLPRRMQEALRQLIDQGWGEAEVVAALLEGFINGDLFAQWVAGDRLALVRRACSGPADPLLVSWFSARLEGLLYDDSEG
jgi:Ca-activated chloride channel homolog